MKALIKPGKRFNPWWRVATVLALAQPTQPAQACTARIGHDGNRPGDQTKSTALASVQPIVFKFIPGKLAPDDQHGVKTIGAAHLLP